MFELSGTAFGGIVLATALLMGTIIFTIPNEGEGAKSVTPTYSMPSQQMSKTLHKAM